eukprot:CAMPEP_0174694746 /NCGR_PEP_ID=MMETSP1094-20130205/1276_1 /TAXON_ID=156173 /ORGANISM="Chrysochromulina brevifilum, Strain UTEX LB 985" /LENGTH=405 /DNA_ID=CAMNT_0015891069 /DNA_START=29 /DNA_END=1250 /DNA_ORIENTATION=-
MTPLFNAMVAATTPTNSTITPLKFVPIDPHGRRRPAAHKRRLSPAGLELEGNLNTLGYFSAEICVGTPSKSFDLIVDTGSALTAFPCSDCPHCGKHQHSTAPGSRYSNSQSSTSKTISCRSPSPGLHCRTCTSSGTCEYSVSYTEGSSIRGRIIEDSFWFGQSDPATSRAVRATFGCQTYESGLFYSQVADGISGFSQADTYGPTLFDYLYRATSSPNVFSMCLTETHGAMVLGGAVPADKDDSPLWIPYSGGGSYDVPLVDIKIGGNSVRAPASRYSRTIVDSGTTFMYLPPEAYRPVRDHFRNHCPWGTCSQRVAKGEYPDDYCFAMSIAEVDQLTPMTLHFSNGVVRFQAPIDAIANAIANAIAIAIANAIANAIAIAIAIATANAIAISRLALAAQLMHQG